MQFLEPLEYTEWEIDLDAMRIEDLAVEFVRQSFANQQLVDFGAPARSRRFGIEVGSRRDQISCGALLLGKISSSDPP